MGELEKLWAKSPAGNSKTGEALTVHLRLTLEAAETLERRIGTLGVLPKRFAAVFWTAVKLAALLHDAGKICEGFQAVLRGMASWPYRHEVVSLGFVAQLIEDEDLRELVGLAVVTHHRPLFGGDTGRSIRSLHDDTRHDFADGFGTINDQAVIELATWLQQEASAHRLPISGKPKEPGRLLPDAQALLGRLQVRWGEDALIDPAYGLAAVLLQAAVTMSDHISSAHGDLHTAQPHTTSWEDGLRERHKKLHEHQDKVLAVHGHLLCRAPTGSGKTETALLWAAVQLADLAASTGSIPRLFYLLPYLAAINAMWHRTTDPEDGIAAEDQVGVAHSRAGSFYLATSLASCEDDNAGAVKSMAWKAKGRAGATRLFRETIRIGTPYQLLRGALAGPVHSSLLLDAANSVFILDELHAYDTRRMGMILAATRTWVALGGRVAVLSATMPDVMVDLIDEVLPGMTTIEASAQSRPRHRVRIRDEHLTAPATIEAIWLRVLNYEAVLVVANNIADALDIFDQLEGRAAKQHGTDAVHLLHSRYQRRDRSVIEKAIITRHGARSPHLPGLTVTTQVCEVSLDVSFDVLFTSAAPLEALAQRFGRVNRLGEREPADVFICPPYFKQRKRDGLLFADGVYEEEPVRAAWDALTSHDGCALDDKQITTWLNTIYVSPWGREWRRTVEKRRRAFEELLDFDAPFDDRKDHERAFDELFDGTEAILRSDRDAYATALAQGPLLAEEFLIPLPNYAWHLGTFDPDLKVLVIDGDYDPKYGLSAIHHRTDKGEYRLGEVF